MPAARLVRIMAVGAAIAAAMGCEGNGSGANPAPAVTITGTDLNGVTDVAIDSSGTLVAAVGAGPFGAPGLVGYAPNQLTSSGSPTPVTYVPPSGDQIMYVAAVTPPPR